MLSIPKKLSLYRYIVLIVDLAVQTQILAQAVVLTNSPFHLSSELFRLKVSRLPIGLLVNFRRGKLEWKRLQSNEKEETIEELVLC